MTHCPFSEQETLNSSYCTMSPTIESNNRPARSRPERTAVLLIAHGSRRAEANHDLVEVASQLRRNGGYEFVEVSYLEIARPTIPDGCRSCVEQGATHVLMLPYFLSAGRHVTADLERFCEESRRRFPAVDFRLCPPLGLHPKMIDIIQDRLTEGLTGA